MFTIGWCVAFLKRVCVCVPDVDDPACDAQLCSRLENKIGLLLVSGCTTNDYA